VPAGGHSDRTQPPTSRKGAKTTEASSAGIPGPTATPLAPRSRRLPRRRRNLLLCVHIMVAVGALGTDTILLTLGVTGLASPDANLVRATYLAMDLLVTAVLVPPALAALGPACCWGWAPAGGWPATGGCWPSWP
jgi:hypothetical protein